MEIEARAREANAAGRVIQATSQAGLVTHSRQSLADNGVLGVGRNLEISYPHGQAGLPVR